MTRPVAITPILPNASPRTWSTKARMFMDPAWECCERGRGDSEEDKRAVVSLGVAALKAVATSESGPSVKVTFPARRGEYSSDSPGNLIRWDGEGDRASAISCAV